MAIYRACDDDALVAELGLGSTQAFVPGGFFLGWLIETEAAGANVPAEARNAFLERRATGPEVFASVDGVLDEGTIAADLVPFAVSYLRTGEGGYFSDMADWFPLPSIFDVRDTWHDYEWMRIKIIDRYSRWRSSGPR